MAAREPVLCHGIYYILYLYSVTSMERFDRANVCRCCLVH
jgi:hypothetical protein